MLASRLLFGVCYPRRTHCSNDQADGDERWRNLRELANLSASLAPESLLDFLDRAALMQDQDLLLANAASANTPNTSSASSAATAARNDVQLMTIHASKGLEFDTVFIVGAEEDLLPHFHSVGNNDNDNNAAAAGVILADDDDDNDDDDCYAQDGGHVGASETFGAGLSVVVDLDEQIDEERRLLFVAMTRAKRRLFICHSDERMVWGAFIERVVFVCHCRYEGKPRPVCEPRLVQRVTVP